MTHVDAANAHATLVSGINALHERRDRALPRATLADNPGHGATGEAQRDVSQRRSARPVAEAHVLELDVATGRGRNRRAGYDAIALQVHDLEQAVGSDERILDRTIRGDERHDRTRQVSEQCVARHELTRREAPVNDENRSYPEQSHDREPGYQSRRGRSEE